MTVKDFLSRVEGIGRIDLIDSEGFVIHMSVTAITVMPYLDSEIDTLEFVNNETDVPGDNDVKVIIKLLSNSTKHPVELCNAQTHCSKCGNIVKSYQVYCDQCGCELDWKWKDEEKE